MRDELVKIEQTVNGYKKQNYNFIKEMEHTELKKAMEGKTNQICVCI